MLFQCSLCERLVSIITYHHLTPRGEGGKFSEQVALCQPCHSTIHKTFSNKELAKEYNTITHLKKSEKLQKYVRWIKRQQIEKLRNK